jgi:hypothetical protein
MTAANNYKQIRQAVAWSVERAVNYLIVIFYTWHQALDTCNYVRVLFVDYFKVFGHFDDTTVLTVLSKMASLGIPPLIYHPQQWYAAGHLGPHVFLILFNNLESPATAFKFVDDVTPTEKLVSSDIEMQLVADQVADSSDAYHLSINVKKTKEMLIRPTAKLPLPPIALFVQCTERATPYKLLGVSITNCLNLDQNVDDICFRANQRLHILKPLKHSAMPLTDHKLYY